MSKSQPKPNILFIITDQQRRMQHWNGQVDRDRFLPSMGLLRKIGAVEFENTFIASSMCSPSRAALLTSAYACQNGVAQVDETTGDLPLDPSMPNLLKLLASASYQVVWKGKWHLGYEGSRSDPTTWLDDYVAGSTTESLQWNPNDAGTSMSSDPSLGGGTPNNDERYYLDDGSDQNGWENREPGTSGMKTFLSDYYTRYEANARAGSGIDPFCMFASFVNPHDCHVFNTNPSASGYDGRFDPGSSVSGDLLNNSPTGGDASSLDPPFGSGQGVTLDVPPNNQAPQSAITSSPSAESRPEIQVSYSGGSNPWKDLPADDTQLFVNFYAYLQQQVDVQIYELIQHLEGLGDLLDNTIIIRLADHGEQALSHGFREKGFNCYEETIRVPLIMANPAFAGLSDSDAAPSDAISLIDVAPTIADLIGEDVSNLWDSSFPCRGRSFRSLVPFPQVQPSTAAPNEHGVVFCYDDLWVLQGRASRIRCIRTARWKYAIYYTDSAADTPPSGSSLIQQGQVQFELYNLGDGGFAVDNGVTNPDDQAVLAASELEQNNLATAVFASAEATAAVQAQWKKLHTHLLSLMPEPEWYDNGAGGPVPPGSSSSEFPEFGRTNGDQTTYPHMVNALPVVEQPDRSMQGVGEDGWQNWMDNVTPPFMVD